MDEFQTQQLLRMESMMKTMAKQIGRVESVTETLAPENMRTSLEVARLTGTNVVEADTGDTTTRERVLAALRRF